MDYSLPRREWITSDRELGAAGFLPTEKVAHGFGGSYANSPGQTQSAASVLVPIFGRTVHPCADSTSTAMPICRRVNWRLRSFHA